LRIVVQGLIVPDVDFAPSLIAVLGHLCAARGKARRIVTIAIVDTDTLFARLDNPEPDAR
jgi:hypothetical protein